MLRRYAMILVPLLGVAFAVDSARAQPPGGVDRLDQIGPALMRCWEPVSAYRGMAVTVRFSLKRSGELLGEPRITYSNLSGMPRLDRQFIASVLSAIEQCLPLDITDGLGGAIAGRPITVTFSASRPGREPNI